MTTETTEAAKTLGRAGGLKTKAKGTDYKAMSKLGVEARRKKAKHGV